MRDKYFLDTNIFVYSFDTSSSKKQKVAKSLIQNALKKQTSCTSSQVIQEFINVATKKFKPPLTHEDCQKYMDFVLTPICEAFVSVDLLKQALNVAERWRFSFYDSLIIAAALQTNCTILYSEDMQHEQKIQTITIRNPFA